MQTDPEEDYARGSVPFLDCTIFLDSRPLIPRTETEYWLEKAIEEMPKGTLLQCLDLFAGSGAIGVAVLKHLPESRMDFGEIDATHFPTIEKNLRENAIEPERAHFIETDVFSGISGTYDYIFTNPPYLSRSRTERIQAGVLAHEPEKALFAEEDGFALIRKTIENASTHLKEGGVLFIEHDPEQSAPLAALAALQGFHAEARKDQYGVLRYSKVFVA